MVVAHKKNCAESAPKHLGLKMYFDAPKAELHLFKHCTVPCCTDVKRQHREYADFHCHAWEHDSKHRRDCTNVNWGLNQIICTSCLGKQKSMHVPPTHTCKSTGSTHTCI